MDKEKKVESFTKEEYKKRSQFVYVCRRFYKNRLAMVGLAILLILILTSIFCSSIFDYTTNVVGMDMKVRFTRPCAEYPFGTDHYGRDILTRILYGGRTSLLISVIAIAISLIVGGLLGAVASYFGGFQENVIMRLLDILMAVPGLLLAVAISASLGVGKLNCAIAIGVSSIPSFARIIRASVLSIKGQEYIEAAKACGVRDWTIILRHVIPNSLAPIMVQSTLRVGESIMMISSLSFIGLGVQPPTPEWGSMLAMGRDLIRDFWPIVTFPGIAIMLTLIAFNLLGDGLRDALDPRLKQ